MKAQGVLAALLPGFTQSSTHAEVTKSMAVGMWGVALDQCQPFTEMNNLASLRYQSSGTREVVVACISEVRAYLINQKGIDKKRITPNNCANFLKTMDKATVEIFAKQYSLFHATVGPGEIIYTPAMFACVERISCKEDAIGLVVRGLYKTDSKASELLGELVKFYEEVQAAAPVIAAAKACFESAKAAVAEPLE